MKSKFLAGPYIAWMAIFTVVPLAMVAYFAFTDNSGAFTLENLAYAAEYWPVLLRSVLLRRGRLRHLPGGGLPGGVCHRPVHASARSACSTCW